MSREFDWKILFGNLKIMQRLYYSKTITTWICEKNLYHKKYGPKKICYFCPESQHSLAPHNRIRDGVRSPRREAAAWASGAECGRWRSAASDRPIGGWRGPGTERRDNSGFSHRVYRDLFLAHTCLCVCREANALVDVGPFTAWWCLPKVVQTGGPVSATFPIFSSDNLGPGPGPGPLATWE